MLCVATASAFVNFEQLPDAAIAEIAAQHKLIGDRKAALKALQNVIHHSTYAQLDVIIADIKTIAEKHGVPEAVKVVE